MAHEKGRCWVFKHVRFQIGLYSVGFIAGLAALIVFSFVLITPAAAVWGGISMLYSGFLVIDLLRGHNIQDKAWVLPTVEQKWKFMLKMIFAVVGFSLSGTFCIYYIIMWIQLGDMNGEKSFLAAVQSWMTFKWSMALTSHLYRMHNIHDGQLLPS